MMKFIWNSVYGLNIINKENYIDIYYCMFKEKIWYFIFLIELNNDYFEKEFVKS